MIEKVKATGVEKILENGLSIYPNPTNGELCIKSDSFYFDNIVMVDCAGKQVYTQKMLPAKLISFNPNLSKGIYILKICYNAKYQNVKIVIN